MASIQRIKSPLTGEVSYRVQVRVKGHAPQGKTFPNRKEAQQWGRIHPERDSRGPLLPAPSGVAHDLR